MLDEFAIAPLRGSQLIDQPMLNLQLQFTAV
jgi:hypothetical protein